MAAATSNSVGPNSPANQTMMIENPTQAAIKLKIKVGYTGAMGPIDEEIVFSGFDASLWS